RLMEHLQSLEATRRALLRRMPTRLSARFDRACEQSSLPESIIAALLGVGSDEMWDIRNRGLIAPGALPRVRAFAEAVESTSQDQTDRGNEGEQ
ncbi:MAG: transcriptional regulator, partial [Mycobacterium sp.]